MWAKTDDPELDDALRELGRARFVFHQFGRDLDLPDALAAVHDWGGIADVVIVVGPDAAMAYRTPTAEGLDPFAPSQVHWSSFGTALETVRALRALPPPGAPDAPRDLVEAPPGLGLSAGWRVERKVTISMAPRR